MGKKSPAIHVLVVDDDRLLRWAVAETLGTEGYEVTEAYDVPSAMQACDDPGHRTDLVLLDMRLADADGGRVLSCIRARLPDAPVILMTASGTPLRIDPTRFRGGVVLAKPFDMSALADVVGRTLREPSV